MIFITTLYNETCRDRAKEYLTCLDNNIKTGLFSDIFVIYDTSKDNGNNYVRQQLEQRKVKIENYNGRVSYTELFAIGNRFVGETIVIANGDIYFDGLLSLINEISLENRFVVLSRWNDLGNGQIKFFPTGDEFTASADAWIYRSPIRDFDAKFKLGACRCDGRISYEAEKAGYEIINPCYSIKAYHLHNTGYLNNERYSVEYEDGSKWNPYIYFTKIEQHKEPKC